MILAVSASLSSVPDPQLRLISRRKLIQCTDTEFITLTVYIHTQIHGHKFRCAICDAVRAERCWYVVTLRLAASSGQASADINFSDPQLCVPSIKGGSLAQAYPFACWATDVAQT